MTIPQHTSGIRRKKLSEQAAFWLFRLMSLAVVGVLFWILGFIIVKGIGVISWEFLTGMPRDGMTARGNPARHRRDAMPDPGKHSDRLPAGNPLGHLYQRVHARQLARQTYPHHDEQPQRRAVDRVRPIRHGAVRQYARLRRFDHSGIVHPRTARTAHRDPYHRRSAAPHRQLVPGSAASHSGPPNCKRSAAYCCRWPCPTSSPG